MTELHVKDALPQNFELLWYQIKNVLGRGGFGVTYLAKDKNLDHTVAIKEYFPSDFAQRDKDDTTVNPRSSEQSDIYSWGLKKFISEARTLAKFKHPNIVRVLSVFDMHNTAYMVMEYERGRELAELIKRNVKFTEQQLLDIVIPILEGLESVHTAGFIHRDIKPGNIILRKDKSPVLLDFGSARQAISEQTQNLTSLITYGYTPFEQYQESTDQQGPWTDIYALSATLYCAITGNKPIETLTRANAIMMHQPDPLESLEEIAGGRYSTHFLRAIDTALNFHYQDRPQSCSQWRDMLLGKIPLPAVKKNESTSDDATRIQRVPKAKNQRGRWSSASPSSASEYAKNRATGDSAQDQDSATESAPAQRQSFRVGKVFISVAGALVFICLFLWQIMLPKKSGSQQVAGDIAVNIHTEHQLAPPKLDAPDTRVSANELSSSKAGISPNIERHPGVSSSEEALARLPIEEGPDEIAIGVAGRMEAGARPSTVVIASYDNQGGDNTLLVRKDPVKEVKVNNGKFDEATDSPSLPAALSPTPTAIPEKQATTIVKHSPPPIKTTNRSGEITRISSTPVLTEPFTSQVNNTTVPTEAAEEVENASPNHTPPPQISEIAPQVVEQFLNAIAAKNIEQLRKAVRLSEQKEKLAKQLFKKYRAVTLDAKGFSIIPANNQARAEFVIRHLISHKNKTIAPKPAWKDIELNISVDKDGHTQAYWQ